LTPGPLGLRSLCVVGDLGTGRVQPVLGFLGVVFLPGAAGTVQEVFQDACENYYATADLVAPMVLVGERHWTATVPAWPLLKSLSAGRAMEQHVHLVDTVDEAAALISATPGP